MAGGVFKAKARVPGLTWDLLVEANEAFAARPRVKPGAGGLEMT